MAATLHLLRHAKSSWDDSALADRDRPLAPRGRRAGKLLARHVRDRGIRPDLVVCSPAVRARQTLELVAAGFDGSPPPVRIEEEVYGADAEDLVALLRQVPADTGQVLAIGHNPGFRDLALLLGAGEAVVGKFPSGALASFEVRAWVQLGPEHGRLIEIVRPKQLS